MLKKDGLIIAVAVISGFLAFILIVNFLQKSSVQKFRFVVALKDIKQGEKIDNDSVGLTDPMPNKNYSQFFLQVEDVLRDTAIQDIKKGSLVSRSSVSVEREASPKVEEVKSLPIPPGMRAMTLSSRDIERFPDGMKVGSYVDLLGLSLNSEGARDLQNLVKGAQVVSLGKDSDGEIGSFTLALSATGAIIVSKALTQGKLSIFIRPDGSEQGEYQSGLGYVEIIRGIDKEKSIKGSKNKSEPTQEMSSHGIL